MRCAAFLLLDFLDRVADAAQCKPCEAARPECAVLLRDTDRQAVRNPRTVQRLVREAMIIAGDGPFHPRHERRRLLSHL